MNSNYDGHASEESTKEASPPPETPASLGVACATLTARSASAQEIALYGGWLTGANTNTYSWAIDHTEGFEDMSRAASHG
jgi:hypothetical protein